MIPRRMLIGACLTIALAGCNLRSVPSGPTAVPSLTAVPSETPLPTITPTPLPTPTPIPQVRVATADEALFNGDFTRARDEYQIALATSTDPEIQAAALWGLGRVEYADHNSAKALEYLRQMVGSYPSSKNAARAYFLLGEIYASLTRYAESTDAYDMYLSLRPGVIDDYVQEQLGDGFNADGKYPEAILAYQAALAAPHIGDNTALQIKIAQAYASAGDTVTALAMFDTIATNSSNDYVKAEMDLLSGQIYLSQGKTDQAYEKFLHTVDNYPLAYDSYSALVALVNANVPVDELNRGLVDYYAGQNGAATYGYALDAFNRYLAANPQNDGTVVYYKALALVALGQYEDSVPVWKQFLQDYPANSHWAAAWNYEIANNVLVPGLAFTQWYYLDQYDEAAQTLLDYVNAAPSNSDVPSALLEAGRIYERANQLEDAAHVWEGIANVYPGSDITTQALFWAGIAYYRLGKYDQALLDFQRDSLLASAPEDKAAASFWTGKTQQKKGDSAAAQSAWQQAAALDPSGYYSLRADDMLFNRPMFAPPPATSLTVDLAAEQPAAEAWIRIKFNLPADTDLSTPGALLSDPRLVRGTELWNLGWFDEARLEFEDLRQGVSTDPAASYRLANYMLDLGLYRSAISAIITILNLAGMDTNAQMQAAPVYFTHVRFGLYYQDLILSVAQQNGFQPLLLFAIVRQESRFEGFVRSTAGARGLMQIVPSTGDDIAKNMGWPPDYSADDLYRPLVSLELGAHYLMTTQTYLGGDLVAALAGYNGGPGNAQIWQQLAGGDPDLFLEIIRYEQTRDYIRGIYENFAMYRSLYETVP